MANLQGYTKMFAGNTTAVDSQKLHNLGTRSFDKNGNEYVYLLGVALTAPGSWVSFDEDHATILAVANAVGRIAVAMAATVAAKYGWYQIYGVHASAYVLTGFADNGVIYLTGTGGSVDDADVAGDLIIGAMGRGAAGRSGAVTACGATVELNYPFVNDAADN